MRASAAEYRSLHLRAHELLRDRKSTRLNSSHDQISYAVFCLKKKNSHVRFRTARGRRRLISRHKQLTAPAHYFEEHRIFRPPPTDRVFGLPLWYARHTTTHLS